MTCFSGASPLGLGAPWTFTVGIIPNLLVSVLSTPGALPSFPDLSLPTPGPVSCGSHLAFPLAPWLSPLLPSLLISAVFVSLCFNAMSVYSSPPSDRPRRKSRLQPKRPGMRRRRCGWSIRMGSP